MYFYAKRLLQWFEWNFLRMVLLGTNEILMDKIAGVESKKLFEK